MNDLVARLSDALQRQHDLILELQQLKDEFNSTINHIKAETDRLQQKYDYQPPANLIHMPTAPDLDTELDKAFRSTIPVGIRPTKRE